MREVEDLADREAPPDLRRPSGLLGRQAYTSAAAAICTARSGRPSTASAIAIVSFAVGWFIAAGHGVVGTDTEWQFAGLIAFAAAHLP